MTQLMQLAKALLAADNDSMVCEGVGLTYWADMCGGSDEMKAAIDLAFKIVEAGEGS